LLTNLQDLFDKLPEDLTYNVTGWLVYNEEADKPTPALISTFEPYDDFNLVPVDGMALLKEADYTVTLDVTMDNLGDGAN
jgi:iron transport multicopper oxidase